MALVVETGAGVAGADSYISVADADTYFTEHGSPSTWTSASTAEKESALRYAAVWVDDHAWLSTLVSATQALAWPRNGFTDHKGRTWLSTQVPGDVVDAQCEAALAHLAGDGLNAAPAAALQEIKADVLGLKFKTGGTSSEPSVPSIVSRTLQPYTIASGGLGIRL